MLPFLEDENLILYCTLIKAPRTTRTFGDFASRLQSIFAQKEQTETEDKDYEEAEEEEEELQETAYTSPGRYSYTKPGLSDEDFEYEGSEAERARKQWGPGSIMSLRLYKSRKRGNDGRWKLKYRLRQKSNSQVCVSCCMLCALR